ncbi:MAG: hypothetical protein ACD_57C00199G0001 [uncultured bacterium]|nr:MAG: hypothetical protein ACD_57C00199G0001 [uncultured bacterium]KKR57876.1 MAG: hypothetical protein UT95_C0013G0020 [Candidatus Curtissbacteria bacterium GW2011_GWB1_40_28]KKR61078.1 MAG: hypothetical protein UT99_C0002G0007 [Candidatus Curtissbacteria bacterium GW2011_GWA2_40_31]KKR61958.1 MAG: hypothetical protein UU00_C0005G0014 [Microgenomates group bacterium GW2011_GWC1_40_35]KKR66108.1 MAG: hypothetical protein UU05_C0005G0028 [Candidatus Curtissbacteria bacterium GW2011_GWA1_40_47]
MGTYGGFYKGERKKLKKEVLEKKAAKIKRIATIPQVEILGKKGK